MMRHVTMAPKPARSATGGPSLLFGPTLLTTATRRDAPSAISVGLLNAPCADLGARFGDRRSSNRGRAVKPRAMTRPGWRQWLQLERLTQLDLFEDVSERADDARVALDEIVKRWQERQEPESLAPLGRCLRVRSRWRSAAMSFRSTGWRRRDLVILPRTVASAF